MREAYGYCERLVREADRDRFFASLFAPASRRGALHALYAFDIETARIRTVARQAMPGEIRLQWWREVLHGERDDEGAANPVAAALLDAVVRIGLARDLLLGLLDAREFDLYDDPMPTLAALEAFVGRTSGAIVQAGIEALAPGGALDVFDLAQAAGAALGICGILRDFPLHASRRQIYVPAEVLERHGADIGDVYGGRTTFPLLEALRDMRRIARQRLHRAHALHATAPNEALPALLPAFLVSLYLDRMDRPDYDPFTTVVDVPQWRRQWTLWRAARRARA